MAGANVHMMQAYRCKYAINSLNWQKRMNLKATYNRDNFINFFRDQLLPEDFISTIEYIDPGFKSKYYHTVTFLGECPSLDLNIYEVKHSSVSDARIGLSRDAFKLVSRFDKNNALILFVPSDATNFRFSLVTVEPKLDETGKRVIHEYSNPKRFSFVLGEYAKTHTPEQYLISKGRISDIVDLKKRFSVEVVNKEFYNRIAEIFSKLVGGKRKKGNKTIEYQRILQLPEMPQENDQKYKEFAVRLIGRTVFCWFLKKKKSESGIPLIPEDVLSTAALAENPGYYHARVEPLFFGVLNTPVEKRSIYFREEPYNTIPFLNGGLFEPQSDDFYDYTGPIYTLKVPDEWWKDFLEILEIYNFTLDENTTIDIDLSVDPEMLGRIFENLLAEINPETGETARKATGSYYTPRSIVEYMVDESLKQYLITKTGIEESTLDILLDYSKEESGLYPEEEQQVIRAFDTIKILDPACGSGAFPIGILQKMLLILQKVDKEAEDSIHKVLEEISDPVKRKLIEAKLKAARVDQDKDFIDYARKLSIIQRSIYGIDIQPIATDISKLRFFLSLIVDEIVQDDQPNRGVEPLPNLEFKFVCANTLIPLPTHDVDKNLFEDIENIEKLEKIREDYFIIYGEKKEKLKKEFKSVQAKMFTHHLNTINAFAKHKDSQTAKLLEWNPFKNEPTPWFDAKWMFGIEVGFNIVLSNPPWVSLLGKQSLSINKENSSKYLDIFNSNTANPNLYEFFIIRSFSLLENKGHLVFITPDRLGQNSSTAYIRENILKTKTLKEIVYRWKFENVIADTVTTVIQNSFLHDEYFISSKHCPFCNKLIFSNKDYLNLPEYIFKSYKNEETKELVLKIKAIGKPLNEFCSTTSGFGGKSKLITDSQINRNQIKILKGSCIQKYKVLQPLYFDFNSKNITGRTKDKNKLGKRIKILLRKTGDELIAAYDDTGIFPEQSLYFLYDFKEKIEPFYLLSLLNSKLFTWYYLNEAVTNEDATPQLKNYHLDDFPIVYNDQYESKFIEKANKLNKTSNDTSTLIQIDLIINKLYNLNYDEVILVDPDFDKIISQKDYESKSIAELAEYEIKIT